VTGRLKGLEWYIKPFLSRSAVQTAQFRLKTHNSLMNVQCHL